MYMSLLFWIIGLFVFGLAFGSFLNVVIFRIDELETIWLSRSHCPKCKHILAWFDLIPFFSFILLKTRCRYCQKSISWRYPLVEIATAFLLPLAYYFLVTSDKMSVWAFLPLIVTFGALIVTLVLDLKTMTLALEVIIVGIFFLLISYLIRFDLPLFLDGLAGSLVFALIPLLIILVGKIITKKDVMGWGDVILAANLGLMLDIKRAILALLLSFILGGIISLVLLILKKVRFGEYSEVPFGPFLIIASLTILFWGDQILKIFIL